MQDQEQDAVLALDSPRAITLKNKERVFTYHLRHVGLSDWAKYFQGIVNQVVNRNGEREEIYDSETAALELVNSVLTRVDGYGDLSGTKNWREAVPLVHRRAIGIALRSVNVAHEHEDAAELAELVTVKLNATWPMRGKTTLYSGLIHRFRQPSIEQYKRFRGEAARVKVRGDAKDGVSIFPSSQAIAMKMYDDLIESVEGYSVRGAPLVDVEAIKEEMDGAHKAAAALELFMGGEVTIA